MFPGKILLGKPEWRRKTTIVEVAAKFCMHLQKCRLNLNKTWKVQGPCMETFYMDFRFSKMSVRIKLKYQLLNRFQHKVFVFEFRGKNLEF